MPRFTNSIIQVSEAGDFETQLEKLYNQLRLEANQRPDNFDSVISDTQKTPQDYNYSNILKDSGSGRITSGLKSLELISVTCSGSDVDNLFLFDNVIYAGSSSQFKTADDKTLTNLVIANLGLEVIVAALSDETTADIKEQSLKMARDVKVGNFFPDNYKKYILSEAKRLTRLYIQKQNQTT